jgi:hypothetical protein
MIEYNHSRSILMLIVDNDAVMEHTYRLKEVIAKP